MSNSIAIRLILKEEIEHMKMRVCSRYRFGVFVKQLTGMCDKWLQCEDKKKDETIVVHSNQREHWVWTKGFSGPIIATRTVVDLSIWKHKQIETSLANYP